MENPKDIKKLGKEEAAEVSGKTPEEVEKEFIEKAKVEDISSINTTAEATKSNLKGMEKNPKAKIIINETEGVVKTAGEDFNKFQDEINTVDNTGKRSKKADKEKIAKQVKQWFEDTTKLIENDSPLDSMEKYLEVLKDEVLKAREKGVDLSSIPDLDERIKDFEKKIEEKREKEEKEKPEPVKSKPEPENLNTDQTETAGATGGEEIKPEMVSPEPEKIIPEPEPKPEPAPKTEIPETEETAEDIKNKELADEIEREINEEKLDKETKERLQKWDKEENKDQKIGEKKGNIKEKLGDRLIEREREKAEEIERAKERGEAVETEEGARLINQENVKKILESRDELVKLRNEIGKEAEDGIKERKRIAEEIKGSIDPNNPELAKLNIGEKMMAKEAVFRFLKTTKDILSLNEIDYLLEAENIDFGDLPQTHEKREIEMEELQATIDAIEEYKKFMEKFEIMTEEQQEEAREEVIKLIEQLSWYEKHRKKLYYALVAAGIVMGIYGIACGLGMAASAIAPLLAETAPLLTVENAIKVGALGAAGYVVKKKKVQAVLKTAATAVGLPILGAAFIADSIFNSRKLDEWMEWATGTRMMFDAGSERKK